MRRGPPSAATAEHSAKCALTISRPLRSERWLHATAKADWSRLDEVFFGCANQAGEDNRNVARMALLLAGLPDTIPGVTVNRLCASGLNAVGDAARAIRSGEMEFAIAGGVESMTRAPFVMGKASEAFSRAAEIYDTTIGWRFVNPLMKAQYGIRIPCPRPARTSRRNFRSRAKTRTPSRFARNSAPARRPPPVISRKRYFRCRRRAAKPDRLWSTRTSTPTRHDAGKPGEAQTDRAQSRHHHRR